MKPVKLGKDAARELEQAALWYEKEQPGLGVKFIDAFESAISLLGEPNPPLTTMPAEAGALGARKLVLHKFPFSIVVYETRKELIVLALAHHSQKPGYWKGRLDSG